MNLLQMEFDLLPTKISKEDKAEYIQALIDTRDQEDINIFFDCMGRLHCQHLKADINQYLKSVVSTTEMVDKQALKQKMVDKWSVKPSLAEKLVDILGYVANKDEFTTEQIVAYFGFNATTAKRYLRQLTEFGYLEAHGGNKNRTYQRADNGRGHQEGGAQGGKVRTTDAGGCPETAKGIAFGYRSDSIKIKAWITTMDSYCRRRWIGRCSMTGRPSVAVDFASFRREK